jgi:ribosomal protein S18 acetylase RimI-like enzyme
MYPEGIIVVQPGRRDTIAGMGPSITITAAETSHVAAIVAIERAIPGGSIVALTHGRAVEEAIARGHGVAVALDSEEVIGWAWWSVEDARGGERIGQLSRIAVAPAHRRIGIGRALAERALVAMREHGATAVRLSADTADADAVAFFASIGFAPSVITMEQAL